MDLGIKGRRAIVTGGGSGIGYETARLFLEEGVRVLIAGRTADKINKARDELATSGEVHAVQADMTGARAAASTCRARRPMASSRCRRSCVGGCCGRCTSRSAAGSG